MKTSDITRSHSILAVFLIALFLVLSCNEPEQPASTTYTVTMAIPSVTTSHPVQYDLTAYEFNEAGEKVANNSLYKAVYGTSKTFTASPRAVKVKFYVKLYSESSAFPAEYLWVQQVFYLEAGKSVEILLEEHTKVGRAEP